MIRAACLALAIYALAGAARAADNPPPPTVTLTQAELAAFADYHETAAVAAYASQQAKQRAADVLAKVERAFPAPVAKSGDPAQSAVETPPTEPDQDHAPTPHP